MTEEEAAIKIQSKFRGQQIRKKYKFGSSANDLDEVTANFIREYCHRWKAKSIFQVLLHYRAVRRHDLVYLSQQVHLYNQVCVSRLQDCRKEASLSEVQAGLSRVDSFHKPSVCKLPFRLIDNPHFWDTSPLCDPSAAGDLADDVIDWDAPLRRNEKGRKKNTRDQEVQTGEINQGRRVSISHTQAPFCRYPNSNFVDYAPIQPMQVARTPRKGQDFRGMPSAPNKPAPAPPVTSRNRFESSSMDNEGSGTLSISERRNLFSNDIRSGPSPGIREQQKKFNGGDGGSSMGETKASPKPPLFGELLGAKAYAADNKSEDTDNNTPLETDDENNLAKSIDDLFGDVERIADASPPKKLPLDRPVNPVYEMEMRARRGEQQSEDGPPFNFQGMLRKTNYCRQSLKRNPGDKMDDFGQPNSSFSGVNSYKAKNWDERDGGGKGYSNNNYSSSYARKDIEPGYNYKPSRPRRNSDKWKQQEDTNVHQLAPGIVLEGQEEEL